MVRRFRSGVGAVLLVLTLMAMVSGTVLASGHIASDGQTLADQSQEVQDLYASVYGDDAAVRWAIEHDRELGFDRAAADDMAMGDITLTQEYQDVYAAALERSGDAELSHRIALDVLGRGTTAAFLAGTDPGVLYGIWVEPVAAERVVTRTRTVTVTVPGSAPAVTRSVSTALFGDRRAPDATIQVDVEVTDVIIDALPAVLVSLDGYDASATYSVSGLPRLLTFDGSANPRTIVGTPREVGSYVVTYTATATETNPVEDVEADMVTDSHDFTINVVAELPEEESGAPSFASARGTDRTFRSRTGIRRH